MSPLPDPPSPRGRGAGLTPKPDLMAPDGRHGRQRSWAGLWLPLLLLVWALAGPVPQARASLLHLGGPIPADLGAGPSGLAPCRTPAHCARASWPVANADQALASLLPAVLALDGVEVVETSGPYLHATVTSRLFGFVDDLELFADAARGQLQARSQSRLGDSDLGVNARRLERLHGALLARANAPEAPAAREGEAP